MLAHGRGTNRGAMKGIAEEFAKRGYVVLNVDSYGRGMSEQPISDETGQGRQALPGQAAAVSDRMTALDLPALSNMLTQNVLQCMALHGCEPCRLCGCY